MKNDGLNLKKEKQEVHSFLLIGQSNMAGRGDFADVEPIKNPNCYMLRMGRWQTMAEPINPDRDIFKARFHSGVGLSASFADEYAKYTGECVGLIPCADGGTSITQWQPGEILFDHAVMMTRLAMRTSTFSGILWHQGESDCRTEEDFLPYRERFLTMITALRRELGAEELPLLVGELSEHISAPKWQMDDRTERFNRMLHDLERELPMCRAVSAEGLSLMSDGLHFNAVSQRTFGRRYFEALRDVADLKERCVQEES